MKHEKDKKFARWLVKVLLPGYHLQKDREGHVSDSKTKLLLHLGAAETLKAKDVYPTTEE